MQRHKTKTTREKLHDSRQCEWFQLEFKGGIWCLLILRWKWLLLKTAQLQWLKRRYYNFNCQGHIRSACFWHSLAENVTFSVWQHYRNIAEIDLFIKSFFFFLSRKTTLAQGEFFESWVVAGVASRLLKSAEYSAMTLKINSWQQFLLVNTRLLSSTLTHVSIVISCNNSPLAIFQGDQSCPKGLHCTLCNWVIDTPKYVNIEPRLKNTEPPFSLFEFVKVEFHILITHTDNHLSNWVIVQGSTRSLTSFFHVRTLFFCRDSMIQLPCVTLSYSWVTCQLRKWDARCWIHVPTPFVKALSKSFCFSM